MNSLDACDPALNATVSASAGSGKTWLLITRIVRLLINGAEPGNIIALTFTRKAAGEMQIRLNERLFEMATATGEDLTSLLQLTGCKPDEKTKAAASGLYEKLMHSLYPVRIQTFHSFCQDILSRFPLEADIPPAFDLIEDSSLLERQAGHALFDEAQQTSNTRLNNELDTIMQFCNGPDNTLTALNSFLAHRSDWWAYTEHTQQTVDYACNELAQSLQIDENTDPLDAFLNDITRQKLKIFANLLREIKNKTSEKHAITIDDVLSNEYDKNTKFLLIKSVFIKKDGELLIQGRQLNASLVKKLGAENANHFIELHHEIAENIQLINEQIKRLLSLKINKAWFYSGHRYVEIFQQLKTEMRLLDFTDLEWKCYQLLQHADNAHWVQYKIDQRIDHILIDEFQDTNPTQWHLLSPILDEIAANPEQRARSVFLVGDEKQSIYSFRRANPALQAQASQWLADRLNAKATPLDFSRRSSSAIIHCVNQIFEQDDIKTMMKGFITHDTYLDTLPGQVLLCDLFEQDESTDTEKENDIEAASSHPGHFRNPLQQPRDISVTTLRHKEAEYIARQILQLINTPEFITDNGAVRAVEFGDIIILMRNRTHLAIYENTLKHFNIPFIGSKKGGLLDNLEIQDLNCLLNTLITPYNNLAFAQVLKSPLFNASDDDLIMLAEQNKTTHWYERLLQLASEADKTKPGENPGKPRLSKALQRAATLLPRWQKLAEHLPVHDCLDKIFSEGNIIKRYMAVNKAENRQKVASNCQRFLELSLETDSGRYPSITRFLQRLSHLQYYSATPPEEPLSQCNQSRVRLMTIHGSKGLESPVVFLADCNSTSSNKNAYSSLVRWPANKSQPVNFQLQLSKDNTDQITQNLQLELSNEQAREELNLLYVALTRAREQLYISGIANNRNKDNSWYQIIAKGLQNITETETTINKINCRIYRHLNYDNAEISKSKTDVLLSDSAFDIDERLLKPVDNPPLSSYMIAPSLHTDENFVFYSAQTNHQVSTDYNTETARWRGIIIHRLIELLCNTTVYPATKPIINKIVQQLKTEISRHYPDYLEQLDNCVEDAVTTFNFAGFKAIFNPAAEAQTYNEMPLMYMQKKQPVYGIIDRVIKSDDTITIIDYKSHQLDGNQSTQTVAQQFSTQLDYYRNGINKLWPGHKVKAGILFTHHKEIVWLE
jgi:ATP-dependent helicase/nuclease subunit A